MKLHLVWIVRLLACTSLVLCQDGISINDATKGSTQTEVSSQSSITTQKSAFMIREEQIEDELGDGSSTTEKYMEKRKFVIKPIKEEEYRDIFTVRFNDSDPTTIRNSLSTTKRIKASFLSSFKKYEEPENVNDEDVDVTTSLDSLTKVSPIDNGERKNRQRLDGLKGVTTNRGKTRFQNEPGTSEVPEISTILRHKKPIRVKPIDQLMKDEIDTTTILDDFVDTTTVVDNSEINQRPKFKKPPLIATHHPNFGTSTEASRRPAIRPNISLKQKISSSTIKARLPEFDVTESDIIMPNNKSSDVVSSNIQSNKIRPAKVIAHKGSSPVQQPIPPTATAWALASLKAPNNSNRIFRKPINVTNMQEQVTKIKPFVTWSTRLQKINEENFNTTYTSNSTLGNEFHETSTGIPIDVVSNESNAANRLTLENISTDSSIDKIPILLNSSSYKNDSTIMTVGGDTDQNKYEVYGSQKPDVENATTVIETLRPSSSTIPSESQNSNLLLVTSYKSILENNNTSEIQKNVFPSSESTVSEISQKKEIPKDKFIKITTDQLNNIQNIEKTLSTTEIPSDNNLPVIQTSINTFSKTPGILYDYSENNDGNKSSTIMTGDQSSSSDVTLLFSHNIDLNNENHSSTTEHYIESIKTKLKDKITEFKDNHDSSDMVNFTHIFSSDHPISSSTEEAETLYSVLDKTTSELPPPSNEILNTSQVPSLSYSPDNIFTDFESNSTDNHDTTEDDGQKNIELSSQSSIVVNEPTSDSDISENDVPIITTLSTSTISTTTMPTTTLPPSPPPPPTTTTTTTIITTPKLTTTTTTPNSTTTTTTPSSTTTTTTIPSTTTTTTTPSSTTTTTTPSTTTTTTTSSSTTITTTIPRQTSTTTITPKPITTQRISTTTSSPIIIESTTMRTKTQQFITTTYKPNSITSRPKPAVIDISSTTLGPNELSIKTYLQLVVNSTMEDVCDSEDELKDAIIKLFESGTESVQTRDQIQFLNVNENECLSPNNEKSPVRVEFYLIDSNGDYDTDMHEEFINLLDNNQFDYKLNVVGVEFMKRILNKEKNDTDEHPNPRLKTAIYLSCIATFCIFLILILIIIRKRQKRFNYGQRCTPVSLDDYSMDNISVYNSVRRKGALRASKRSYGNPAFDDSAAVSHSLNFAGLASFSEDRPAIDEEFSNVPVITVKPDELLPGTETKNRYANVIPIPETRVLLNPLSSAGQNSDYINANFVKGYKGADKFYIACQAPMQSTLPDFWQMIWDQNTRVIMMVTSLTEKGVERCADYLPPSEVLDCHRLFGDYQVTLKKREVKDKFIISHLQLKNMELNLWRDVTHLWYGGWPVQGVPSDPGTVLAFLSEARSHMKSNNGPNVVHCSPGTGRTGTVIACDICIREFEVSRTVDVPKTVYAIRRCRAGAVQTRDQYALIYKVVNLYASKLSGGVLDSI